MGGSVHGSITNSNNNNNNNSNSIRSATSGGGGSSSSNKPKNSSFASIGGGPSAKQVQSKLLKAVATFMVPTSKQLVRLDPDLEGISISPSSFR